MSKALPAKQELLKARQLYVAEELGIPPEKVTILPYHEPSSCKSDWLEKVRERILKCAEESRALPSQVNIHDYDFSYYGEDFFDGYKPKKFNMLDTLKRRCKQWQVKL